MIYMIILAIKNPLIKAPFNSIKGGAPKSSILLIVSVLNHPFLGAPYFRKPPYGATDCISMVKARPWQS
jgi:hypothetical protein